MRLDDERRRLVVEVSNEDKMMRQEIGGEVHEYPWVWLRDNCQCPQCFEKISKCRIINLTEWEVGCHCFYRQPGEGIQIGPNWDLSKALNNRYRLPAPPAPGHFGVLLIKMHLLAFVVVAIKWIIRPKIKKNLFS